MYSVKRRIFSKRFFWLVLSILPFAAIAGDIVVEDAWIREAPPGAHVLAGYVKISNKSANDVQLLGVESDQFGMVMLHKTQMDQHHNMSMHHMEGVSIPARSTVELKPGEMHIMLMQPARDLRAGDKVSLRLRFSNNVTLTVSFVVRRE